jgi:hypothetical protein
MEDDNRYGVFGIFPRRYGYLTRSLLCFAIALRTDLTS